MYASRGFIASAVTATVRAISIARRKVEFELWFSVALAGSIVFVNQEEDHCR